MKKNKTESSRSENVTHMTQPTQEAGIQHRPNRLVYAYRAEDDQQERQHT
jgi:hypothetical protein